LERPGSWERLSFRTQVDLIPGVLTQKASGSMGGRPVLGEALSSLGRFVV